MTNILTLIMVAQQLLKAFYAKIPSNASELYKFPLKQYA